MEEIYKPNTDGPEKVEVYSRENNDMLGDMPEWLIHTGSYIVYGLIVFLIAGTALFKYPDTIRKTITIDDLGSAEWITANQAGMIDRFFVENQSPVQKNDTLGILKNNCPTGRRTNILPRTDQNRMVLPHQRHQVPARLSL
jgi:hypothetical protein